ncbi:hypothetical protein MOQ72_31675 [Saccharopolyspora sp. K220]|uniref:hypothetical protein n=1 Tax=Saccharopolyspora soli TaxID=2926618 RepID=UPI001F5A201D|nr:hypothetical protein [Saccharopolyspora soli]MCI2422001.1 hypothetical protein [Saccharopolyspora soli]
MPTTSWSRVLHAVVEYVRVMNDLSGRYLLAWPPQPEPLHWVRRGDVWLLRGEVLPEPPADN